MGTVGKTQILTYTSVKMKMMMLFLLMMVMVERMPAVGIAAALPYLVRVKTLWATTVGYRTRHTDISVIQKSRDTKESTVGIDHNAVLM